uniref:BZIP domain-containing protein n=1 Tax=Panagrolaimus sp. ES5 TaxID=591445 RepID=A0AC34GB60_9BILA
MSANEYGGYPNGNENNANTPQNYQSGTVENLHAGNQHPQYPAQVGGNRQITTFQNQNVIYQGREYQNAYGYGPTNNVPQYITTINYQHALYQQRLTFQNQSTIPGHSSYAPNFYQPNAIENQQGRQIILHDSPPNFRVPSNTTQILSENDNDSLEGLQLLDISSDYPQHRNSDGFENLEFPPLEFTNKDLDEILNNWTPDDLIQMPDEHQTVNDETHQHNLANGNPANIPANDFVYLTNNTNTILPIVISRERHSQIKAIPAKPAKSRSTSSSSSSSGTTKNPVGRPAEYENDEQRKEAHKEASKKSYKKRREEKAEYRQEIETTIAATEAENQNLRARLAALRNQFVNIFNANYHTLTEEERAHAQRNFYQ